MKILITTHHLKNYSGSKRWVYTIAKELNKEHDVTVATPIWGGMFGITLLLRFLIGVV